MSGNGNSYQKNGGVGVYHEIPNGAEGGMSSKKKTMIGAGVVAVLAIVGYFGFGGSSEPTGASVAKVMEKADLNVKANGELKLFDKQKRFVQEDYDAVSTFASFLPGVAGYFGKPVWAFYVNRGQGISTFGTESKDYPLLEFNAANKAYQLTPYIGFRSFVRGSRGSTSFQSEPFTPSRSRNILDENDDPSKPKRILYVGTNELEIQELDGVHGLTTNAEYFIMPEENYAALVRRATFTNSGDSEVTLDILDGLAKMEPAGGMLDGMLKNMGRTVEGWFGVYHADDTLTMPFYKLSTEPSDEAKVKIEQEGHYLMAFVETEDKEATLLPIVFDTNKVFGKSTSLESPRGLQASSVQEILDNPQYGDAKTSCAFAAVSQVTLQPGENITIASVYGKAHHIDRVPEIAEIIKAPGYIQEKAQRAKTLINNLTASVETNTANPLFDGAVKQMFLDNSLRGGMPTIIGDVEGTKTYDEDPGVKVFHAFSRIHGDLERDYNAFKIEPAFFSQGPGNYRDVAQNRRDDVAFTPRMGSFDVQQFLSFIQADGYEPLTVEAVVYQFTDSAKAAEAAKAVTGDPKSEDTLTKVLKGGPFRPGQLFDLMDLLNITITASNEDFVNTLVAGAEDFAMAVYGQGYWADHWDYYVDLIEAYLSIYPDEEESLMYDTSLRYFFSTATVKPRSQKYILTLTFDGKSKHVQQLESTYYDQDKAKEQEAFRDQNTGLISIDANWQRTPGTSGTAFKSSALAKLFLLGSIKFAMRDAWGMGIEYEGGRPGWLDSMNGLPGMVGSGMPETYELYLLLKYVKSVFDKFDRPIIIPSELWKMVNTTEAALDELEASGYVDAEELTEDVPEELFEYWDVVASARENYRNDVEYYFSGNTTTVDAKDGSKMISRWLDQIELGMKRAAYFTTLGYGDDGSSGVPACFFSYEVTDWALNKNKNSVGLPCVNAKAMKVGRLPMFLEGPVRYMKTIQDDQDKMKDLYQRVLKSGLRDTELKMYFLSATLKGQTYDIGRQIAFAPGWLENQSIWMHMSYKYYLQLIRGKLYEEFFSEMKGGGILPFMDAKTYGRSLMECSSFIASSAFPDPSIHGEGFLARLSGSTAEFMSMWKLMFIGPTPFYLNKEGDVEFQLVPAIPSWLFEDPESDSEPIRDEDGSLTVNFKLFAHIVVTYHNPSGGDIYGEPPKKYKVTMADDSEIDIDGSVIPTDTALEIRRVKPVKSIDAYY
ncbi:expressed unknown protein [Seminavis robusta]|uniref:Uncharacterized protein n=1 Tax=Seminavis robusta TaxID=568900 RepID=A0A9N8EYU4_9STRA|nr:expressed unknown protein [Seminavis robusta]|eukprot:Sro2619_g332850.1 n/a (1221) ;mRNA; r:6625-10817